MKKKSKYQRVSYYTGSNVKYTSNKPWRATLHQSKKNLGKRWQAYFATEREAAIAYDTKLIELGLEPVNILKRK